MPASTSAATSATVWAKDVAAIFTQAPLCVGELLPRHLNTRSRVTASSARTRKRVVVVWGDGGVGEWIWIGCIIPIDDPRLLLLSLLLFRGGRAATHGRACSGGGICCVGSSDVHVSRLVLAHVLLALAVAYFHCDPPCAAAEEGSRHRRAGLTEQPGVRGPPRAEERGRFFAWLLQKQQRNKSGSSANSLPAKRKADNLPKPRPSLWNSWKSEPDGRIKPRTGAVFWQQRLLFISRVGEQFELVEESTLGMAKAKDGALFSRTSVGTLARQG